MPGLARQFREFSEAVKLEHSVFALPFAMVGMVLGSLASRGGAWPGWPDFLWIVVAMVGARTAAMAYNRIVDRDVDAANPRTSSRAVPAGRITLPAMKLYFSVSVGLFLLAAWRLSPLALALAPVALVVTLGYSHLKRVTWLSHWALGLGLGIAPAAAYIAVADAFDPRILWPVAAVVFWTEGFDILYSLQDQKFDRSIGLHSVPARWGARAALAVSRGSHAVAVFALSATAWAWGAGWLGWAGVVLVAALLAYEQSLVRADDLRRLDAAFFAVNGLVSIGYLALFLADFGGKAVA